MKTDAWIQTFTGRQFWPFDAKPEDIRIEDIAHALSMKCRFTGHCKFFYSVAHHSIIMATRAPKGLEAWALLHDATEAYLPDIARPIKSAFRIEHAGRLWTFDEIENRLMAVIAERFTLPMPMPDEIKRLDLAMLATEARDVMAPPPVPWTCLTEPPIDGWIRAARGEDMASVFLMLFDRFCAGGR